MGFYIGRVKCSAVLLAFVFVACSGDDGVNPMSGGLGAAAQGGGGSGATGCTMGQMSPCQGASCADGSTAQATCQADGTFGQCQCADGTVVGDGMPTVTTAGQNGMMPAAGATGSGGMTAGTGGGAGGSAGTMTTGGTTGGVPAADGSTWPLLGYDTKSQYYNPHETTFSVDNASSVTLKWSFTVSGYPAGSPIIAEGKAFVSATGGVYAINLADGTEAWSRTDLMSQSTMAYADGAVYVHTQIPAELHKLSAADGSTIWGPVVTYDNPNADGTSSPIVAGDVVMVGHSTAAEITPDSPEAQTQARGGVGAYSVATGDEVWHYYTVELPENGAMVWSTVSVDLETGTVYAATGNNYTVGGSNSDSIHAIDLGSGERRWVSQVREGDIWTLGDILNSSREDSDFGANPIIADFNGRKLVAAGDKASDFWALDRETGDVLWNIVNLTPNNSPQNGGVLNNGGFDGTNFYVLANDPIAGTSRLVALNPDDGTEVWSKSLSKVVWGMPTMANGLVFAPVNDELHIYSAADGELLNTFNTGGTIAAGGAAVAAGSIVVQSGVSYPLDPGNVILNDQVHCYGL